MKRAARIGRLWGDIESTSLALYQRGACPMDLPMLKKALKSLRELVGQLENEIQEQASEKRELARVASTSQKTACSVGQRPT